MLGLYERIRPVDVTGPLAQLSTTAFEDTGGTNGWLAIDPRWLDAFVQELDLGGLVLRAVCRKLPPYQGIPPHIDPSEPGERRFHVPLLTHPAVTMRWPEDRVETHLEAGWLYEVCFTKTHEIVHLAPVDRVHVQINVAGA